MQTATRPARMGGGESPLVSAMPAPAPGERPAHYADRVGKRYTAQKSDRHRKELGLYLTPIAVADFMAGRIETRKTTIRMLDPAAGAGVLCCAAVEALVSRRDGPKRIELVAFEIDGGLIAPLRSVLGYLAEWARGRGTALAVFVECRDFVLARADALSAPGSIFPLRSGAGEFDVVIANPPWFKIGKTDPRAAAAAPVVYGQPNIYALFMAVCAALLRERGCLAFIVPRSFASGYYFRRFRNIFFGTIRPTGVHVFESRRDVFVHDGVLQENIVLFGVRQDRWIRQNASAPIAITSSQGIRGIAAPRRRAAQIRDVLDPASPDMVLRLPTCKEDADAITAVESWPNDLHGLGLRISTGPVVAFRAKALLGAEGLAPGDRAPFLWMGAVRPMRIVWPLRRRNADYISRSGAGALLVPNRNYVLLRRFSAREEARRLTAAPWMAADSPARNVGFENHLNYIHRPGGALSDDEAWGLAALYNSRLLDVYFRTIGGNTQVNAAELRAAPLPDRGAIVQLGRRAREAGADCVDVLDALVARIAAKRPPGGRTAAPARPAPRRAGRCIGGANG